MAYLIMYLMRGNQNRMIAISIIKMDVFTLELISSSMLEQLNQNEFQKFGEFSRRQFRTELDNENHWLKFNREVNFLLTME